MLLVPNRFDCVLYKHFSQFLFLCLDTGFLAHLLCAYHDILFNQVEARAFVVEDSGTVVLLHEILR